MFGQTTGRTGRTGGGTGGTASLKSGFGGTLGTLRRSGMFVLLQDAETQNQTRG